MKPEKRIAELIPEKHEEDSDLFARRIVKKISARENSSALTVRKAAAQGFFPYKNSAEQALIIIA